MQHERIFQLGPREFDIAFPFHFSLNRQLRFINLGNSLRRIVPPLAEGHAFEDHFLIRHPESRITFDDLLQRQSALFIFECRDLPLTLKGQLMYLSASDSIVFLGSPWLTEMTQVQKLGLSLSDFAIHDSLADFLLLLQAKNAAIADAADLATKLEQQSRELRARNQALIDSEQRYRSVVDNVKEVIFQTDASGLWTFLNRAWSEITGFSSDESIGQLFLNYVHPQDRTRNNELFAPLIARQKDYCRHEVRYLTKDGGYRWIEVYARLTLDANNNVVGTSGTLNDVTERRAAEDALRHSENRFQAFMDNSPAVAFIKDAGGKILYANKPMLRRFNMQLNEVVGKLDSEVWPTHATSKQQHHESAVLAGTEVVCLEESFRDSGQDLGTWLSYKFPLENPNGEKWLACMSLDITERKYYERQLESYQLQLEGMIASLEKLATTDPLTNTYNKGALRQRLEEEIERARRYTLPLSLVLLDIDHFKQYNDTFGHPAGDQALSAVAGVIKLHARGADYVARYGGEEFAIIMPNTPIEGAFIVAERIRRAIEMTEWQKRQITVSVGVATMNSQVIDGDALILATDKALYVAKSAGRNQVTRAT